jgi:hypothetical protein
MPFLADIPSHLQERVVCSISAAVKYEVPANLVLAVAEKEAGKPGQWVRNSNGTHDVGPMQFNTTYLRDLARYGITANDVAAAGCYPFDLAAWRLRMHLRNDKSDLWTKAANYHSRTPTIQRRVSRRPHPQGVKVGRLAGSPLCHADITQAGAIPSTTARLAAVQPVGEPLAPAQMTPRAVVPPTILPAYVPRQITFDLNHENSR